MPDLFTNATCFRSQQCVEKYLKAYPSFVGRSSGKTYDIAELIELCKENDGEFDNLYKINANKLTKYAVEVRYSDEFYILSKEEAKQSVEIAKKVKSFVLDGFRKEEWKF